MAGVPGFARRRRTRSGGDDRSPAAAGGTGVLTRFLPIAVGLVVAAVTFVVVEAAGDDPAPATRPTAQARSAVDHGRTVFARMGCGNCHKLAVAGTRGEIGSDLDAALPRYDRAALRQKILNPNGGVDSGTFSLMPEDFGERLSERELDDLVAFLLASRDAKASP